MYLIHSPHLILPFHTPISFPRNQNLFSKIPLKPINKPLTIPTCSPQNSNPSSDNEILQFIADENTTRTSLPSVRTYENDLGRLSLIGVVGLEQALTAAAADGGMAADEHIAANMPTMVVETVFPGPAGETSTVSTRLFLPARKVKEMATKLRTTVPAGMMSGKTSRNILAMTFRQVVLQYILSFELRLFGPGVERNMEDLESPREVPAMFTLSSSDERVLSSVAEAVCMYAIEGTKTEFRESTLFGASESSFGWFKKPRRIASKDLSVIIFQIPQDEFLKDAKIYFENFNKMEISSSRGLKSKYQQWMSSTYLELEKIGGTEFVRWASEFVPAYRLHVDASKLKNVKFEGWKKSAENRWEVLLTHSQMVELADILDMYYEDVYTSPNKQLSSGVVADVTKLSKNKSNTSLWKELLTPLIGGLFVVSITIAAQGFMSRLYRTRKPLAEQFTIQSHKTEGYQCQDLDVFELENLCIGIVKKIKDAVGWPGDIETDTDLGAWTGELPGYLKKLSDLTSHEEVSSDIVEDTDTIHTRDVQSQVDMFNTLEPTSPQVNADTKASVQDIASYQVVLSKDGNVVGFQPTSRIAVNHWANNPLAKELYSGRKLTPGLIEPGLKIQHPDEIILLELLMSVNPNSRFALARPLRESR